MAVYSYEATDKKGGDVTGMVEADTLALAINQVRSLGYFPTKVKEDAGRSARRRLGKTMTKGGMGEISIFSVIRNKDIVVITRQLATLIDAGLPLVRSLNILFDQLKAGKLRKTIGQISDDVQSGMTFSEALGKHPKAFSKLYVNMVRAGEAGGMLEIVLNRLAEFMEKRQALRRKVVSAMVYPLMVVLFAGSVVAFLVTNVVPKFAEIFAELGAALPGPTQFLVNISNAIGNNWREIIIYGVAGAFALWLINKPRIVKAIRDRIILKLPLFGGLVQKSGVAHFSRTLGTLVTSGVPILQSLTIVKDTVGNVVIANAIAEVHDSIREGETIAGPLEESKAFPPMAVNMIDVGEETGNLDSMLLKVADIYDAEVDATVGSLLQILEPFTIISLGGCVGFIVFAMYLPIFSLTDLV